MGYQAKEGDLFVGIYEGEERQFVYGGIDEKDILVHMQVYYFADGEDIGGQVDKKHARDVEPKSLVRHIGMERWNEVLSMPSSLQKQAKLEEILRSSNPERKKLFGFI